MELWQIHDKPEPFRMAATNPHDVEMNWLASKEHLDEVWLPRLLVYIENLTDQKKSVISSTPALLRRRDRERVRCGLPLHWESIAADLEKEAADL